MNADSKTTGAIGGAGAGAGAASACCVGPVTAPLIVGILGAGGAAWAADAPDPDWWEHQLGGLPDSLRLDPERFAEKAAGLLSVPLP